MVKTLNGSKVTGGYIIWGGSTLLWGGSTLDDTGWIDSGADPTVIPLNNSNNTRVRELQ